MNLYMLDTDTCSYIIRERPIGVLEHYRKLAMAQTCISSANYAELLYGVARSSSKRINRPPDRRHGHDDCGASEKPQDPVTWS